MRTWSRRFGVGALAALATGAWVTGCLSRADGPFIKQSERGSGGNAGTSSLITDTGGSGGLTDLMPSAPHAVTGVTPSHGVFSGGSQALVSGNGFTSAARVWFGDTELPHTSIVPVSPQRLQVTTPARHAGTVDVAVQNGDDTSTRAVLSAGYTFDQFYADPASGPTTGGTIITLQGDGTQWNSDTTVEIDQKPCVVINVTSKQTLTCTTPPGTQGAKPIRVKTADGVETDVLDAFTYGNSDNGFKGGLSGNTLSGSLKVLALNNLSGLGIPGATVIVGSDLATADLVTTDADGVAVDTRAHLGPKQTVTVACKCFQPQTFVDVPVDSVTVFLDPVLSPACGAAGDLPPSGGVGVYGTSISGEVVWPATAEFKREGWTDVPNPKSSSEALVAYVLPLASSPTAHFKLPSASEAITPSAGGDRGFAYSTYVQGGNLALYALAGIENRSHSPPQFTAYSMGLVRGVSAQSGESRDNVYIQIDVQLDHALTLDLTAPDVTTRGPDRMQGNTVIQVGGAGYALLPNGYISQPLPLSRPFSFVGVPPLVGSLLGTNYVTTARAVTGEAGGTPLSVVAAITATSTSAPLALGQFVAVPALTTPAANTVWDGKSLGTKANGAVDLAVFQIESGNQLIAWQITAPGNDASFALPDLSALPGNLGLISGPLTITVSKGNLNNFDYGGLRYQDLNPATWHAYATDVFYSTY